MNTYAGIGSRETPADVLTLMEAAARRLAAENWVLRSGGANGADSAFERGAGALKEIYIPWPGFNGSRSPLYSVGDDALALAQKFHPAWNLCSASAKKLHARNCYQILGLDLKSPVAGVICWTRDGRASGGTGQALRIAESYGIKILNLRVETARHKLEKFIA